jgi:hypothetical protein
MLTRTPRSKDSQGCWPQSVSAHRAGVQRVIDWREGARRRWRRVVAPWHWRCVRSTSLRCAVSCPWSVARCPSFVPLLLLLLLLLSESALRLPRRANRSAALQGRRGDRETRNGDVVACNRSCLARSVRCGCNSNMYEDTCRVDDRVDKSMFRREWGSGARLM